MILLTCTNLVTSTIVLACCDVFLLLVLILKDQQVKILKRHNREKVEMLRDLSLEIKRMGREIQALKQNLKSE